MYDVTLRYENGSIWYVGQFKSQADVDVWVQQEQTRPYWNNSTIVEVVFIPVIELN